VHDRWFHRAVVRHERGRPRGAIEDATVLLAVRKDFPDGLFLRGICEEELGDRTAALADFERLLAVAPRHPAAVEARRRIAELKETR